MNLTFKTNKIKNLFSNKVIFYLFSRYLTYFIQFVVSIILASKLGAYYLGIWGFIVLLINYFGQIDFGISNSLNVLLVQNRYDVKTNANYIKNSILIICILSVVIILIALYDYYFRIQVIGKYNIQSHFILICIIGILQYFNTLFMTIFRVYNKLLQVIINQSITVFLSLIIIFFFRERNLVFALVSTYVIGNLLSVMVYLASFPISLKGAFFSLKYTLKVFNKGTYLFIYNGCFYFIITSTRSLISYYYSIEEFGVFSFAFTLSNSIMLLLGAFSFLIFPKVISKLSSQNLKNVSKSIEMIMINYTTFAHVLIYICMIVFPFISGYFTQYTRLSYMLNFISLAVLINSNSFGHISFLIAQNREKTAAFISITSLLVNLILGVILIKVFFLPVQFVIIVPGISYLIFGLLAIYKSNLILNKKIDFFSVFTELFPMRLFFPFVLALIFSYYDMGFWIITVVVLFVLLNLSILKSISTTIQSILKNSHIINL